jgi:dipeptidyl aminopeptidase/acylaminoacyl peptidase
MTWKWLFCVLVLTGWVGAAAGGEPRIERDRVQPHWFAGGNRFWYRLKLFDGRSEFVVVDAERGLRQPAFDAELVAREMGDLLHRPLQPDRLPVESLDFETEHGALLLQGAKASFRLDLSTGQLTQWHRAFAAFPALVDQGEVHPSRDGGDETEIIIVNQTAGPVSLDWIDPDGQRRPYGTVGPGESREQNTYAGHVWVVSDQKGNRLGVFDAVDGGGKAIIRPATDAKAPADPPAVSLPQGVRSPDGKWFAVVSNDNLYLRPAAGGQEVKLSDDGKPSDAYQPDQIWWAPDSASLVAMRVEPAQEHLIYTVESSPPDRVEPRLRTLNYLKPGDRIEHPHPELFQIATRRHVPVSEDLFANPWSIEDVRWAADSSRFTFVFNQRGHQALRVIAVDAGAATARAIVDERSDTFIDYSGHFYCNWINDKELIWMSERDGWNHLWLYDAAAGTVKNQITRGPWVVQKVTRVDAERRQIWFMAGGIERDQDPYFAHLCRVNFDGSGLIDLTPGNGTHVVQWSPDNRFFLDVWSRVDLPPVTELRNADGRLLCRLETADTVDVRPPEPFVAKGRDGQTDIFGVIWTPPTIDPGKRYPVVEQIYAGPQDFYTPKSFHLRYRLPQELAEREMFVVQCDGMGTSGRSRAFHDVCWKNLRDAGFPDRIAWIKAAAQKHPEMDLNRVGIYGGSAGGQNALAALIWHHDFYKVAVADCGCHDNRMDKIWWNEQWMGWPVGPQYAENSNVVNAHLMEGKLMLIVGELDDNVDPASTMQVVNALEKADKDFELVIVAGAHHGAAETPYGYRRRMDFLLHNLIGGS